VRSRWALGLWLACVVLCIGVISRTEFTADLSAFLPRSPTPVQQVLVDQLRDGVVSRLVLIGLDGSEPQALAETSKRMAAELRRDERFAAIANGEDAGTGKDRDFLWRNRYLLSPAMEPEHFTADGLRAALEESLQLLGSPAGILLQRVLPSDPTGEMLRIAEALEGGARPELRDGVWFSPNGSRALLVAQTRAPGYDIDAQESAIGAIRSAFSAASAAVNGASPTRLAYSGPGVFAVNTRARIEGDAIKLSLAASVLMGALMLAVYRSVRILGLGLLPVASGVLAGIAAVSLGFGSVHGITLGFGSTLIGEGADYAIYLFTQSRRGAVQSTLDRLWPTLRLGVLTSICGFSAMLFSGFTGLAQLGLFSIAGLAAALLVTRWVLPTFIPAGFSVQAASALGPWAMRLMERVARLRYAAIALVVVAAAFLVARDAPVWSDDLSSLSPIALEDQKLDERLRNDIGAPDVRHLVVIRAGDVQSALESAESVGAVLATAVEKGLLAGFDTPASFLPSLATQRARQAAIPPPEVLRRNLVEAASGMPFKPALFEPFLAQAAAVQSQPLIEPPHLQGTSLALKTDALLSRRGNEWAAMLPLRGVADSGALTRALEPHLKDKGVLLDLKGASDELYRSYRHEAVSHALIGAAAIVVLLLGALRSPRRVVFVLLPLVAAVVVTTSVILVSGTRLSIFHLVGLLLVVAVGSNYALFFDRETISLLDRGRTLVSIIFANVSTMIGFGILSLSSVPVLDAIGSTVALGAFLSLVFSAAFMPRSTEPAGAA
jgi:predicted exporter